jgi:ATP-dependent RNA helicase DeaD
MSSESAGSSFADLQLPDFLQKALTEVGYETPSAIQARTIPLMLEGHDIVGQAQTGTGKTAAFALPILARLQKGDGQPQVLVLTPTRELAIQVAEAFQKYAHHLPGFQVLPIYGGADYSGQLRQLKRGVQVVVGTPGRVMDHMRRGTLKLSSLSTLVLDEADEMLRMGFIDDVEWILDQTPPERQIALFSATMPNQIRRIANRYLKDSKEVTIEVTSVANDLIRQRVWMMAGMHKLDALTRILEVEDFDGIIIFVRTRISTVELADKLAARGYSTAALNGDIPQKQREATVAKLKSGKLDILVATDVAARGLDVERISHVINYDIPYDVEAYVHRIGRTGRAGRHGEAILFAANRERRLLRAIEKSTGRQIEKMELPSAQEVTDKRSARFKSRITETLATRELDAYRTLIEQYQHDEGVPVIEIAAALADMAQGEKALNDKGKSEKGSSDKGSSDRANNDRGKRDRQAREKPVRPMAPDHDAPKQVKKPGKSAEKSDKAGADPDKDMQRFRIEVGHEHGVKPANIVGAISNEAEIDSEYIGRISIFDDYSTVDLPDGMPKELFKHLKTVWVCGQRLQISRETSGPAVHKPAQQSKSNADKVVDRDTDSKARKPNKGPAGTKKRKKARPSLQKKP